MTKSSPPTAKRSSRNSAAGRIRLIHWNSAEASEKVALLETFGYGVDHDEVNPELLRKMRDDSPKAVVIDLSRLPSHGRDVGLALRQTKSTRHVPIVYVEGDPAKVDGIRKLLPDATFTTWRVVRSALAKAIARPPKEPIVPPSVLAGYSGTPLPKKLGIKPNATVALVDAPDGFELVLGELPPGAVLHRQNRAKRDLTVWFVRSRKTLESRMGAMAGHAGGGGLWIAWPKKASGLAADFTETDVRELGLAAGLVDFKVCAIDMTWSGLRFSKAKTK